MDLLQPDLTLPLMLTRKRRFDQLQAGSCSSGAKRSKHASSQATSNNTPNASQSSSLLFTTFWVSAFQSGTSTCGQAEVSGHALLSTLKHSINLLRSSCGVFSDLHLATGTLLEALKAIDPVTLGNQVIGDLPQWAAIFSTCLSHPCHPEQMHEWARELAEALHELANHIGTQQKHRDIRSAESAQERKEFRWHHRLTEVTICRVPENERLKEWRDLRWRSKDLRLTPLSPAHDACYDSNFADQIQRNGCLEGTRAAVIEGIRQWIYSTGEANIYWMNGMAGTGKTAIAYSICTELEQKSQLGASFFCSRAMVECQDVNRIVPTIAYQLAQHSNSFRSSLCRVLGEEPNIGQHDIIRQFERLIRKPLLETGNVLPNNLVVVIDALDECSDTNATATVVDALLRHAVSLPVRFFVTSRPEPHIWSRVLTRDPNTIFVLNLHDVDEQSVKSDIEVYLRFALAKLSPSNAVTKQLAQQAGTLFMYAAIIARYLSSGCSHEDLNRRLVIALAGDIKRASRKDQEIDRLYQIILDKVLPLTAGHIHRTGANEVGLTKQVLWTIACVREPVARSTLAALLKTDPERVLVALQPLRSVLHISEGDEVVSALHTSLHSFVLSPERSGSLVCDEGSQNEYLASRCFEIMKTQLHFNICKLETSYRINQDILGLQDRVKAAISPELSYACRYWVEHLKRSATSHELVSCLKEFQSERLSFWMEVLGLKGWMADASRILVEAQNWLDKRDGTLEAHKSAPNNTTLSAANPVMVEKTVGDKPNPTVGDHDIKMDDPQHDPRPPDPELNSMSAHDMFKCLLEHGCTDLSSQMDTQQDSAMMVGGGGFGNIWMCQLSDGTKVAVKTWRSTMITQDGDKSLKRAMRELYYWSKTKHKNVHPLMGVIMFRGRYLGMVSRWMEHGNLQEYIVKQPHVNRYSLCTQVTSGLSYLHSIHMVHGDLKTMNVLVSSEGVAKLSDFDHSIMVGCSLAFSRTCSARAMGGTTRWMAPELILETTSTKCERTDVYALGMTMLEIVTGTIPYYPQYQNDPQVILAVIKKVLPSRPTDCFRNNTRDNQMWELLVSCWNHEPTARPKAAEVLESVKLIATL